MTSFWEPLFCNDAYQLTMAYAAYKSEHNPHSVAEGFFRSFKSNWNYAVMSGCYRIRELIENLTVLKAHYFNTDRDIEIEELLASVGIAEPDDFLRWLLPQFDALVIRVVEDGEFIFPNTPVVVVEGPYAAVQMVETPILSILNHNVLIATKAHRIVRVAQGRPCLEFGTRRTDQQAAKHGAVAAIQAGFAATSNVLAGYEYCLPIAGTMAHSWVQSYATFVPDRIESRAFEDFLCTYGENTTLLVDTFDIAEGVGAAVRAAMGVTKGKLKAIRIDSGDFLTVVPLARTILDSMGFYETKIILSNDLDEYKICDLLDEEVFHPGKGRTVPLKTIIDGFGVGTKLVRPDDVTNLGFVYKLVYVNDTPTMKLSGDLEKATYPGRKKFLRIFNDDGFMVHDWVMSEEMSINDQSQDIRMRKHVDMLKELDFSKDYTLNRVGVLPKFFDSYEYQHPVYHNEFVSKLRMDTIKRLRKETK